jgi:peroxiredoxin
MKTKLLIVLAAMTLLLPSRPCFADGNGNPSDELKQLVAKIQLKLKDGKRTEQDFAPELAEFDALLSKYSGEKTDDVARILLMKAALYKEVFHDSEKSDALFAQLKHDFPNTKIVEALSKQEERQASVEKIQASLVVGAQFPSFDEKDLSGNSLSLADYKGKIVLIDFWATWCGPCVAELPNVMSTYEKDHPKGFEIIGISLDKERPKLEQFIRQKQMSWPQIFDGQGWESKLAQKYGVNSIPATYLLDGDGKIIAKDLRGPQLDAAVAAALAKR